MTWFLTWPAWVLTAAATALETVVDRSHVFTHRTLHPLVFGCGCTIEHPLTRSANVCE